MRNELDKFNETVAILVKAYLNNTLVHGNCYACAVGNIVAHGIGTKCIATPHAAFDISWENGEPYPGDNGDPNKTGWGALFATDIYDGMRRTQRKNHRLRQHANIVRQIKSTGYSWQELARIEFAFETVGNVKDDDKKQFKGLMRVVDVLAKIHGIDLATKEASKLLFVKA